MRQFTYKDAKRKKKVGVTKLTLSELRNIDKLKPSKVNEARYQGGMRYIESPEKDFHGTTSSNIIKKRAGGTWPDGSKKLRVIERELGDAVTTLTLSDCRRRPVWSDQGDEVDIHRVLGGQLDTAWHTTKRNGSGLAPVVSLVCSWGGNASRSTEELMWSMAATLVAAKILEGSGYSVEIMACILSDQYKSGDTVTAVKLKDADFPLEFETLASVSCFAGVFRSYGFAAIGLEEKIKVGGGYGSHINSIDSFEASKWELEGEPLAVNSCFTRSAAIAEIKKILASAEE